MPLGAWPVSRMAWGFHPQIPDITDLAQAPFLEHEYHRWSGQAVPSAMDAMLEEMKRSSPGTGSDQSPPFLAKCPTVTMKLGGMMMRLAAHDYMGPEVPPSSEQLARALAAACPGDLY